MSGGGRKRSSKWDSKEEHQHSLENVREGSRPVKAGLSYHERESERGWFSSDVAGRNGKKWSIMEANETLRSRHGSPSREPLPGGRSSYKSDQTDVDRMQMSPGFNEWRQPTRHYSPKSDWNRIRRSRSRSRSKSRSRSPVRGFRRQSGSHEKGRSRSGVSAPLGKDFSVRNRDVFPEGRSRHEIPCKYYALGTCRNGKHCRFSHHGQARISPERRSRDDRRGRDCNADNVNSGPANGVDKSWRDSNWRDGDASNNLEKSWSGSKWNDANTYIEATKLTEEKNDEMGSSEQKIAGWSTDHRWEHNSEIDTAPSEAQPSHTAIGSKRRDELQRDINKSSILEPRGSSELLADMEMSPEWNYTIRPSNNAAKEELVHVSQDSKCLTPVDPSLSTHEQAINKEASSWTHDRVAVLQPVSIGKSNIEHVNSTREDNVGALPSDRKNIIGNSSALIINLNSSNGVPAQSFSQSSSSIPYSSLNAVRHGNPTIPSHSTGGSMHDPQNLALLHDGILNCKVITGTPSQNMVSSDQSTQLTEFSASLAQLLGNGKHHQYTAALNLQNAMQVPSFDNSGAAVQPASEGGPLKSNQSILPHQQYNPIADSIDSSKSDMVTKPPGFSVSSAGQLGIFDQKIEVHSNNLLTSIVSGMNGVEHHNGQISEKKHSLEPAIVSEVRKADDEGGVEEIMKSQEESKGGFLENNDGDGKTNEGKGSKESKSVRAFKFALVEFVKDLLKPAWKEGQISKEAYKNIVKKAVDKVTSTMQGTNIPQTQEKIEQYLSSSKPKLSKLVQAYVEKFQKG